MSHQDAFVQPLRPSRPLRQCWPDLAHRQFRRILIIKPSAVGDIVRTIPVLTALRRRWPQAHIGWIVARHCADLLIDHPQLDEIIFFDRHEYARIGRNIRTTQRNDKRKLIAIALIVSLPLS